MGEQRLMGVRRGRLALKQRIHFVFKLVKIVLNMLYVLNRDKTRAEGRKKVTRVILFCYFLTKTIFHLVVCSCVW